MHLFYHPEASSQCLSPEESFHATKVLRLTAGDSIELTDGKGNFLTALITTPGSHETQFRILHSTLSPKKNFAIHLAIAPTKNADRMEWMVEKCTEVGVNKISFVLCNTSERKSINMERLEKITISAMKQSRQARLPKVSQPVALVHFLQECTVGQKFIAHADEYNLNNVASLAEPGSDYVVLIGPEGDFDLGELEQARKNGFLKVSLGPTRLRTETAGLFSVMALNFVNQK